MINKNVIFCGFFLCSVCKLNASEFPLGRSVIMNPIKNNYEKIQDSHLQVEKSVYDYYKNYECKYPANE